MSQRFYVETLGCPKNQVDSDKLIGTLLADGMRATDDPGVADLVVVNTCAFIDDARRESIDTILALDGQRRHGARLVVTGCMAERYGAELAEALPEVDLVAGFGVPITLGRKPSRNNISVTAVPVPLLDLLNLPRPRSTAPWAYVKIAEGCDRTCGFCAIPSFRGPQRSRDVDSILDEVDQLEAREIVLVAQDLASYGKDRPDELGAGSIVPLVRAVAERVDRVRLLYLYPSDLSDTSSTPSATPVCRTSTCRSSTSASRCCAGCGAGGTATDSCAASPTFAIASRTPRSAATSSSGIPARPRPTTTNSSAFVEAAQLDWCGFFAYSAEDGTYAVGLDGVVDAGLMADRLAELRELQDAITAARRDDLIGTVQRVLVDSTGIARSHREAPEIDGVVHVRHDREVGEFTEVEIVDALGPDLVAAGASAEGDG